MKYLWIEGNYRNKKEEDIIYRLNKSIEEISLKDIFVAIEINDKEIEFNYLGYKIFEDTKHIKE